MNANRLLVIDDEIEIRNLVINVARIESFDAMGVEEPDDIWKTCKTFDPTVIVLDLQMPKIDGIEVLRLLSEMQIETGVLLISGVDPKILSTASRLGSKGGIKMLGSLKKPFDLRELRSILANARKGELAMSGAEIKRAISAGEFTVYYQPKIEICNEKGHVTKGAEALVRWVHPQYGLVSPDSFIPVAEKEGLIGPVTDIVIRSVLDQLRLWTERGADLTMSINLSAELLNDLELPDRLARWVNERNLANDRLMLEITETSIMRDAVSAMDVLSRFRLKGFGLSMDDFGTGYSSLVQLYRLPFNELKIDRSFIMDADSTEEARTIIRSATAMAHELGLVVCAEGVETKGTLEFVQSIKCDSVQGYLFGRPMPAAKFETLDGLFPK